MLMVGPLPSKRGPSTSIETDGPRSFHVASATKYINRTDRYIVLVLLLFDNDASIMNVSLTIKCIVNVYIVFI